MWTGWVENWLNHQAEKVGAKSKKSSQPLFRKRVPQVTIKDWCCLRTSSVWQTRMHPCKLEQKHMAICWGQDCLSEILWWVAQTGLQNPHEAQQRQIQSSAPETSETRLQYKLGTAWIKKKYLCRNRTWGSQGAACWKWVNSDEG